jgi:D-glycero-D-manno-heptose 1,7-bisphosphate phosphatase
MVKAVLLDRDGTIVVDVPYNGDPDRVQPIDGAKAALDRLRAAGVRVGILTNQSGVGRGKIGDDDVKAVNARVEELLGPFDGWFICPHAPDEDCDCRKPKPKLVFVAAKTWGIDPWQIAIIGDKQSDMDTAKNAGARGIKVDGARTIAQAVEVVLCG